MTNEELKELIDEKAEALKIPAEVVAQYRTDTQDEDLSDIEEAYSGEFSSDKDFAQNMAEETGDMPKDSHWPLYCIDWEWAARELMMDYFEIDGYYFRHL